MTLPTSYHPNNLQPNPASALNINLRNRVIPRAVQAPTFENPSASSELAPNPQGEYDIIQHLAKIPAMISLRELLKRSPSHQEAMFKFLQGINVHEDLSPDSLAQAVMSLCTAPSIVFYNNEWAPKECQSLPLCISIYLNGIVVESALLDSGASINVCPIGTFEKLGI